MYKFVVADTSQTTDTNANNVTSFDQCYNSKWQKMDVSGLTGQQGNGTYVYLFAYTTGATNILAALAPNAETETLFDSINVNNFNENYTFSSRNYGINIEAYGIQADYLDVNNIPDDVWAKIQS